jgi:hypothetical protein
MPFIPISGTNPALSDTEQETVSEASQAGGDDSNRNDEPVEDRDSSDVAGGVEEEDVELVVYRRLVTTTTHVLDSLLEFSYSTSDETVGGQPSKVFKFGCTGDASNYQFLLRAHPKHFTLVCGSPLRILADQRLRVAEFITRVNFSLVLGHFDLDFDDGELRFRVAQECVAGLADDPSRIARLFGVALTVMDLHFPAIMNLTYGGMSPEQAVRTLEERTSGGSSESGSGADQQAVEQ